MKFAHPTARKEFRRCKKRYYYRYLHQATSDSEQANLKARGSLHGIREWGGTIVHRHLAKHIWEVTNGMGHWDHAGIAQAALAEFKSIAAHSLATEPGIFLGGDQLAESFNGCVGSNLAESLKFWVDVIPSMVENGVRVAIQMDIGANNGTGDVTTEKRIAWEQGGKRFRGVIDVLSRRQRATSVIEWKCHSIDNADLAQVRHYLKYLHEKERIPASELYGFAVDLLREEVIKVTYDPFSLRGPSQRSRFQGGPQSVRPNAEVFIASPHPELCQACPYRDLCPDGTIS
jgi:hypothetical protein